MPFMKMVHDVDPRKVIFDKIGMKKGKVQGFHLLRNDVLCGIYERPTQTQSKVFIPDTVRKEDEHQGKAALVVAMGPGSFESDENYTFRAKVQVGDWITLWVHEGRKIVVNGQLCRIVRDQDIVARIDEPDSVF